MPRFDPKFDASLGFTDFAFAITAEALKAAAGGNGQLGRY